MVRKIIKIILIVLWCSLIFMFSNDTGGTSTKKSDGLIVRTVEKVIKRNLSSEEKDKVLKYFVVPVRKSAHLFIYFILGFLIISLLREYRDINMKVVLLAVFFAFLYACSDEVHQLFVVGRSGQVKDVFIDTFGSFLGVLLYSFIYRFRRRNNN
ncbi:acetobutylicum phosphotransbutyrylase [Mycoplasma sp. CAG:877]|nr:acetobutylicum phosphotransbutyrylase [Mycoplasma sp. CAG:877]